MHFLESALAELANHAPPELRSYFATPKAEAVKKQLPRLRKYELTAAKKALIGIATEEG